MSFVTNHYSNELDSSPSPEFYKLVLESTVECIWVLDLKNRCFRYISPSIYSLRGLSVEEAMKETLEDSYTPQSVQKIKKSILKRYPPFLLGNRSEDIVCEIDEYEQYCKDGSIKTFEISTRFTFNERTQGVDVIGVSRDITKRKQFEKEFMRKLRKKMTLLELHSSPLETSLPRVYFFKKFLVYGINQQDSITWRTSKAEELFAYLLYNSSGKVSKDEIIENLWSDISLEKATTYLHTTLYHMKKDLQTANIDIKIRFSKGYYFYQCPQYYSDISEFEHILDKTVLPLGLVDEEAVPDFERVIALYKGDFLQENDYLWAASDRNILRKQFDNTAFLLSRYYFLKRDYKATKYMLKLLLKDDNLNETAHELLLKVYIQEKSPNSFIRHYNRLKKILLSELGTLPQNSIQKLYQDFGITVKEK